MKNDTALNHRQYLIVHLLKTAENYVASSAIAAECGVSVKSIRNDIATLKRFFASNDCGTLQSKPHFGVIYKYTPAEWERFTDMESVAKKPSPQRKNDIQACLYKILSDKSVSYADLREALYISDVELKRLMPGIEDWLSRAGIALCPGTRKGVVIAPEEWRRRVALSQIQIDMAVGVAANGKPLPERRRTSLDGLLPAQSRPYLPHHQLVSVCRILENAEKIFCFEFGYDAYERLLLQLSFCIYDVRQGLSLEKCEHVKCETDTKFDDELAAYIIAEIQSNYAITLPQAERNYIAIAVETADIVYAYNMDMTDSCIMMTGALDGLTASLIDMLSDLTASDLRKDRFLANSFKMALRSLIGRAKYGIYQSSIRHIALNREYSQYLGAVHAIATKIGNELQLLINTEEMNILAMHIGEALERSACMLRVCIVYGNGVGVPLLLKEQVEREFHNLQITDVISARHVGSVDPSNADLVISTVLSVGVPGRPVVHISPIPTRQELSNLKQVIKAVRRQRILDKNTTLNRLENRNSCLLIRKVLLHLQMHDKNELIHFMCQRLMDDELIGTGYEKSVQDRERVCATVVGKGVAIPHGDPNLVQRSAILAVTLQRPIDWGGGEMVDTVFLLALNLDEDFGRTGSVLQFYRTLLSLMEDDEKLKDLKNSATPESFDKRFWAT